MGLSELLVFTFRIIFRM